MSVNFTAGSLAILLGDFVEVMELNSSTLASVRSVGRGWKCKNTPIQCLKAINGETMKKTTPFTPKWRDEIQVGDILLTTSCGGLVFAEVIIKMKQRLRIHLIGLPEIKDEWVESSSPSIYFLDNSKVSFPVISCVYHQCPPFSCTYYERKDCFINNNANQLLCANYLRDGYCVIGQLCTLAHTTTYGINRESYEKENNDNNDDIKQQSLVLQKNTPSQQPQTPQSHLSYLLLSQRSKLQSQSQLQLQSPPRSPSQTPSQPPPQLQLQSKSQSQPQLQLQPKLQPQRQSQSQPQSRTSSPQIQHVLRSISLQPPKQLQQLHSPQTHSNASSPHDQHQPPNLRQEQQRKQQSKNSEQQSASVQIIKQKEQELKQLMLEKEKLERMYHSRELELKDKQRLFDLREKNYVKQIHSLEDESKQQKSSITKLTNDIQKLTQNIASTETELKSQMKIITQLKLQLEQASTAMDSKNDSSACIPGVWQWYDENGIWNYYPPAVQKQLESGYNQKKKITYVCEANEQSYEIDISSMHQVNIKTKVCRFVRRIPRFSEIQGVFPRYFNRLKNFSSSSIPSSGTEWNTLQKKIRHTIYSAELVMVQEICNKRLWLDYCIQKEKIRAKCGNENELLLFHGTTADLNLIIRGETGFDSRLSNQGYYGYGIYFAENASYSHRYTDVAKFSSISNGDSNYNYYHLLLAHVVCGDVKDYGTSLARDLRRPPEKPTPSSLSSANFSNPLDLSTMFYDSVSGVHDGSRIYVVYSNSQAYPTYLVTYRIRK